MSPTTLVPIANHLFSPEKLKAAMADFQKENPGKQSGLKGSVDSNGVNVALVLGSEDGKLKVITSFSKDWTGSVAFGAAGSIAW